MKKRFILIGAAVLLLSQLACEALNPFNALQGIDAEDIINALPEDFDADAIMDAIPEDLDLEELEPFVEEALPGNESGENPPVDTANLASISAAGITLWYDPAFMGDVQAEVVPAVTEEMAYETIHPDYALFTFSGVEGYLAVAPVEPMKQLAPMSAEGFQLLQNALAARPESFENCAPLVPLVTFYHECSHQQFAANVGYLDFLNGSGLRFVTVYAIQDMAPIVNDNLVYNFEGFSADGRYFLFGEVQIENQMLAMAEDMIPNDVYLDMEGDIMREYFKGWEMAMTEAEMLYDPGLGTIDQIFHSIRVE